MFFMVCFCNQNPPNSNFLVQLVNFVLVLTTGVGLYSSKLTDHPQIVAWAIILAFILAGPLNGAIARLGSMYVYQVVT